MSRLALNGVAMRRQILSSKGRDLLSQGSEKLRAHRAIDNPVVARQGRVEHRGDTLLAILDNNPLRRFA